MKLGEIIKKYRDDNDISMRDFSDVSGLSKAYISLLEKNNRPGSNKPITPSIDTIKKSALGMKMDFNILFNMIDGEVLLEDDSNETSEFCEKGAEVPVLGTVAAGIPLEAIEDIIDYEEIPQELAATGDFFGLRINGDSMEPRMCPGDVVIVRKQDDAENGDTVIAMINGDEAACKRLRKYRDGIELVSNNPAYAPMFFSNEDIVKMPVRILGKVVELRGKF